MPIIIYIIVLCTFFSCKRAAPQSDKSKAAPIETAYSGDIFFINLNFLQKDKNTVACNLIDVITVKGELKVKNEFAVPHDAEDYLTQLVDTNGAVLINCYIEPPLHTHMDVYSEDGHIHKGDVTLQQKEVSLRIQKPIAKPKKLRVSIPGKKGYELLTEIPLPN